MNDPSRASVGGPLGSLAAGFLYSLVNLGYTQNSASSQLHLMAHLSRWLAAQRIDVHMLRDTDIERFLRARRRAGYARWLSMKAMRAMLTYLKDKGISINSSADKNSRPEDVVVNICCVTVGFDSGPLRCIATPFARSCKVTYPATPSNGNPSTQLK
jgi:hypothetical protein